MRFILGLAMLGFAACSGAGAQDTTLRVKQFELVDDNGNTRASLKVEPGGQVVFRLMDQTGTIRVKLGADQAGSGLLLNNDATEPGFHALAKPEGTTLRLKNKDGSERLFTTAP